MKPTEEPTTEQLVRAARQKMAEGIAEYIAAYNRVGLVTGYVTVFEVTEDSGSSCWWMAGSGADPTTRSYEGLAPHRALGLVAAALQMVEKTIA